MSESSNPKDEVESLVIKHVTSVEGVQSDLADTLTLKREAIVGGNSNEMLRLASVEQEQVSRLSNLIEERGRILVSFRASGINAESLTQLAQILELSNECQRAIESVRTTAAHLERQSLTQSMAASRAAVHCSELISLIATGGEQAESYDEPNSNFESSGGNLLDAAA